jgi:PadR family transcriptional regulator
MKSAIPAIAPPSNPCQVRPEYCRLPSIFNRKPSRETLALLAALLGTFDADYYGLQLCQMAGLPSGSVYPILARLEGAGVLSSRWEDDEEAASHQGRRRRYYRLTASGADAASAELSRARRELATTWFNPAWKGLSG